MAFSGDILSLDQVEACIMHVLHDRPAEVGLRVPLSACNRAGHLYDGYARCG